MASMNANRIADWLLDWKTGDGINPEFHKIVEGAESYFDAHAKLRDKIESLMLAEGN